MIIWPRVSKKNYEEKHSKMGFLQNCIVDTFNYIQFKEKLFLIFCKQCFVIWLRCLTKCSDIICLHYSVDFLLTNFIILIYSLLDNFFCILCFALWYLCYFEAKILLVFNYSVEWTWKSLHLPLSQILYFQWILTGGMTTPRTDEPSFDISPPNFKTVSLSS